MTSTHAIALGAVNLNDDERAFYGELNEALTALCRRLPRSVQAEALLFLMRYAGIALGEPLDYFRRYYAPAWSMVHELWSRAGGGMQDLRAAVVTAQAMALHLHSLDDHLNDGELPATHLTVLLRSEAWIAFRGALGTMAARVPDGAAIIDEHLNTYYAAITDESVAADLEAYLARARGHGATWTLVPRLLALLGAETDHGASDAVEALERFIVAWRIVDDIDDLTDDATAGGPSALYHLLPESGRTVWRLPADTPDRTTLITGLVADGRIAQRLAHRAGAELAQAATLCRRQGLALTAAHCEALAVTLHRVTP